MIIPAPERFTSTYIVMLLGFVFVGQQLAGTGLAFSLLTMVFIALWAVAFNIAGGLVWPSGSYIFFNGLLTVVVGSILKIFFFEAGDGTLLSPVISMLVYCGAMVGMGVAAFLTRGLRPARGLIKDFDNLEQMKQAAIVCLIVGVVLASFSGSSESAAGSVTTALRQINRFPLMAVLLATTYEIRKSHGKRSVNWIVVVSVLINFISGLFFYSKEGIMIGPAAWFLAAMLQRYDFPKFQLVSVAIGFAFVVYYLVPYSQYVRIYSGKTRAENLAVAMRYLGDLPETRRLYYESIADQELSVGPHLFNTSQPFLERLTIFAGDDTLIDYTSKGHLFGIEPIFVAFGNVVPHFIWRDKPDLNVGNTYAREVGILVAEDTTTGISFSPAADAFHEESWLGLLLLLPLIMVLAFMITDSLAGCAKFAPWASLPILENSHLAPEGALGGAIYLCTYWVVAMLFLVFVVKYVAPFLLRVISRKNAGENTRHPIDTLTIPA